MRIKKWTVIFIIVILAMLIPVAGAFSADKTDLDTQETTPTPPDRMLSSVSKDGSSPPTLPAPKKQKIAHLSRMFHRPSASTTPIFSPWYLMAGIPCKVIHG